MTIYALDFFQDEDTMITQHKLMRLDETVHRVRKSLYARNGQHAKLLADLEQRLTILERNICHGK